MEWCRQASERLFEQLSGLVLQVEADVLMRLRSGQRRYTWTKS
jgi:hypothetical protein